MGSPEMASPSGMASWPPWEMTRGARDATIVRANNAGLVLNVAMTMIFVSLVREVRRRRPPCNNADELNPGSDEAARLVSTRWLVQCGSLLLHIKPYFDWVRLLYTQPPYIQKTQ